MTTPTLDAALATFSLTRDELPGIDEAWAAQFSDLTLPLPETPDAVLLRLCPDASEWEDFTIDEVTPRSDGSLLIEIDGHVDDDGDTQYRSEQFTLTADEAREFLLARENLDARRTLNSLHINAERTQSGTRPIWWLLTGDATVVSRHDNASRARNLAQGRVASVEDYLAKLEALQTSLDTRTPLTRQQQDSYPYAIGYARGLRPFGMAAAAARDEDVVRADMVSRVAANLADREPRHALLKEAMTEAQALPEGALREFLLGTRESRTYDTTVGTGRGKKTVKRTYTPTSDLVSEHKKIVEQYTETAKARAALVKRLAEFRDAATGRLAEASAELAMADAALAAVWAEGWPGAGPAPEKVHQDDEDLGW